MFTKPLQGSSQSHCKVVLSKKFRDEIMNNMAADMFTKPLQGSSQSHCKVVFSKKFRDEIMNNQNDSSLSYGVTLLHRSVARKYNKYTAYGAKETEG